jgi:hypothetical protein
MLDAMDSLKQTKQELPTQQEIKPVENMMGNGVAKRRTYGIEGGGIRQKRISASSLTKDKNIAFNLNQMKI